MTRIPCSSALAVASFSLACAGSTPPRSPNSDHHARPTDETTDLADPGPSPLASVAPTVDGWFDADPLLVSLRPQERAEIESRSGLPSLEVLPLYDLQVSVDIAAGTFDLDEVAYVTNQDTVPVSELVFQVHGNPSRDRSPVPTRIRLRRGECVGSPCDVVQGPPSVITVKLDKPLPPGGRRRVRFEVTGVLERVDPGQTGLLAQGLESLLSLGTPTEDPTYGLLSVCGGFVSMASFFPVLAARRAGAWVQPSGGAVGDFASDDLAHVRARIDVDSIARIATPGTTVRSELVRDERGVRRRYHVAAAMVRDFGLFAGERVDVVEERVDDVVVRSVFLDGDGVSGRRALHVAGAALGGFERRFGRYPYTELDVVEAPLTGGAGGMEFSGMIAVASMLYRPLSGSDPLSMLLGALGGDVGASPAAGMLDEMLEFTTAHEVAHQWWHGLVGSDSRHHPFVDESLAQYSTIVYYEDRYGAERAARVADSQVRLNYIAMRWMGQSDGAVDRPANAFTPTAYAGLVYGKGPFFFRETRKRLGDEAFFKALRAYADQHRFRTAGPRGPVPHLARGARANDIEALARRWLDERHGDDDLGPVDMRSMLGLVLGADSNAMGPQVEEILRLLGSETGKPGTSASPKEAIEVMRELERMLDSF